MTKLQKVADSLTRASYPWDMPVLCIGVDVTWWGGSKDPASRREAVAYATKESGHWSLPSLSRIKLAKSDAEIDDYTPIADPTGSQLVDEIERVINLHPGISNVVVALDAPLICCRPLPKRSKRQKPGEVERRDCDREWSRRLSDSDTGWKTAKIQPGAPIPCRIDAIVDGLKMKGIQLYVQPGEPPAGKRLIECFPNEVLWSAGVFGYCADSTYQSLTTYKRMGKVKAVLPLAILKDITLHTLRPCLALFGPALSNWFEEIWRWILNDGSIVKKNMEGHTGKALDDLIDSVLSLLAAMAFIDGNAHVHQGNPEDGHIIGPGLRSSAAR